MFVYLDNAATTRVFPEAAAEAVKYMTEQYGNASSAYSFATRNKAVLSRARRSIASMLNADQSEIIFTSGGTEADNLAIIGSFLAREGKGSHIITSEIEHPAVLGACRTVEKMGCRVTYLKPDKFGYINPLQVEEAISGDTYLITIMAANNELGTLEPIEQIGSIAKDHNIYFHTDAVQAFGHINMDVSKMNINMLSASAHKFGGPKGVGFLYAKGGVKLNSIMLGGGQENGMRSGTENVPGIAAMSKAGEIQQTRLMEGAAEDLMKLKAYFRDRILEAIPGTKINSPDENCLPGHLNMSFDGIEGETLLIRLDMHGICCSTGSACSTGKTKLSHVLLSCGHEEGRIRGSLRFSLGNDTTAEEIDYTVSTLKEEVDTLRKLRGL